MKVLKSKSSNRDNYFNIDQLRSELKKRTVRGAVATVISQVSIYGIQMIGTIVLARLLTPEDFGLVAMVSAFSILLQNFGLRGFTEATIQSDVITHKKISTLFWIHLALSSGLALFFIALSPLIAWFYKDPRLESITIVISISFIFSALSTQHLALLTRNMQFYKIAANEVVAAFVATILAIAMAWQGCGYWAIAVRRVVPMIALAAGAWILCRWLPGKPTRGAGVKELLKFGLNTYGNFTTNYLSRNLDKILIGWRYGAQSLGYYERAYYLFVMPVSQLSYPLTNVAVAALSRLRDDPEKYCNYYLKAVSMIALIGMPLSAILTLIGKDFLLLLLGPQWNRAGEIFSVFGPGIGILLIYGTHGWLHLSLGRADRWFRWGIIELLATIIAFIIGLPFGAIGVAIACTLSFYLLIGPGLWYAGKPIHLKLFSILLAIWRYYMAALVAGLSCWIAFYFINISSNIFIELNIFVRILLPIILCSLLYLIFIITLYRGIKPISQFTTLLHEMLPNFFSKISNKHD